VIVSWRRQISLSKKRIEQIPIMMHSFCLEASVETIPAFVPLAVLALRFLILLSRSISTASSIVQQTNAIAFPSLLSMPQTKEVMV
jgi:hypothetical protein